MKYIISCEHGGNEIPPAYLDYFTAHKDMLNSHRGWDKGALAVAKYFASLLKADFIYSTTSRLLIEQNRTLKHPDLFSEVSKQFNNDQQESLINELYVPYVDRLSQYIENAIIEKEPFIHISVHSFTPVLNGDIRSAEIGLLFDPDSAEELKFAELWLKKIYKNEPGWRVKMNYPYLGTDDGLVSLFREKYSKQYTGIELEINNKLFDSYSVSQIAERLKPTMQFVQ